MKTGLEVVVDIAVEQSEAYLEGMKTLATKILMGFNPRPKPTSKE